MTDSQLGPPEDGTELVTAGRVRDGASCCPLCLTPRNGQDRFCEHDGYDFETTVGWTAIVSADRDYHEEFGASIPFPPPHPTRTFALDADEMVIGRRSASRGIHPDIDLADDPEDPAISHIHAMFVRSADGTYSIVDAGSTNGTTLNDDPTPIAPDAAIALVHGDRIHLGAWTTITIRHADG